MSNNVPPGTEAVDVVRVDRAAEMAIYDALPRRWRVLVDSLPVLQRLGKIREYRDVLGDDEAYRRVVSTFSALYPGWTPPAQRAALARSGKVAYKRASRSRAEARGLR